MTPRLYVSYGVRKSGSTLAFRLAHAVLTSAGFDQSPLPDRIERPRRANFLPTFEEAALAALDDYLEESGRVVVVKTHGPPSPALTAMLADGRAAGHAVFRDPREVALSMVDAGASNRELGLPSFTENASPADAAPRIAHQFARLEEWLALPNIAAWPYDDFAWDQRAAMERIAEQIGVSADIEHAMSRFDDRRATQFNKARPQRWKDEMSAADSAMFLNQFKDAYARFWPDRLAEGAAS